MIKKLSQHYPPTKPLYQVAQKEREQSGFFTNSISIKPNIKFTKKGFQIELQPNDRILFGWENGSGIRHFPLLQEENILEYPIKIKVTITYPNKKTQKKAKK